MSNYRICCKIIFITAFAVIASTAFPTVKCTKHSFKTPHQLLPNAIYECDFGHVVCYLYENSLSCVSKNGLKAKFVPNPHKGQSS